MITSPQTRDNFIMSDYTLKYHIRAAVSQKHNMNTLLRENTIMWQFSIKHGYCLFRGFKQLNYTDTSRSFKLNI